MNDTITLTQIRSAIRAHRFQHADEYELHAGLEEVLTGLGLTVGREVRLDQHNRIDLATTLPTGELLGIEAKIAGAEQDVRRQVRRYARFEQLGALLLVTTIARHGRAIMPWVQVPDGPPGMSRWLLDAKPFDIVVINRGML